MFGSNLTQQPYASDHNEISKTTRAFHCYGEEGPSLLNLIRGWQQAQQDKHPLIDTLAAFMFLPAQHPRPRLLRSSKPWKDFMGMSTPRRSRQGTRSSSSDAPRVSKS